MNQLALKLKERGLDAVEESNLTWVEEMRHHARYVSLREGKVTADNVRDHARAIGWKPDKPNAYGAIFRGKHWRCIGRTKSTWPGNHAREIRIWKWVPKESPATNTDAPLSSAPTPGDTQPDSPGGGGEKGALGET